METGQTHELLGHQNYLDIQPVRGDDRLRVPQDLAFWKPPLCRGAVP